MKCKIDGCNEPRSGNSKYCSEHKVIARQKFKEMLINQAEEKEQLNKEFQMIWDEACAAGVKAANECVPTPMVVEQHANPLDDGSPVVQSYYVDQGVCGFASVIVRPGTSAFCNWVKKNINPDAHKAYYGGLTVYYVSEYGQSYEKKKAFAGAFARTLQSHGINAYADSRLD